MKNERSKKVLAARQHEISQVILPRENEKDLAEVPEAIREGMTFHLVETLLEAVRLALADDAAKVPPPPPAGARADRPAKSR